MFRDAILCPAEPGWQRGGGQTGRSHSYRHHGRLSSVSTLCPRPVDGAWGPSLSVTHPSAWCAAVPGWF